MSPADQKHMPRNEQILLVEVGRTGLALHRIEGHVDTAVAHDGEHVGEAVEDLKVDARRLLAQFDDDGHEERVERIVDRHDPHVPFRMSGIKGGVRHEERVGHPHRVGKTGAQLLHAHGRIHAARGVHEERIVKPQARPGEQSRRGRQRQARPLAGAAQNARFTKAEKKPVGPVETAVVDVLRDPRHLRIHGHPLLCKLLRIIL